VFVFTTFNSWNGESGKLLHLFFIPDVRGRVWQEMEYRLDVCTAANGTFLELP
jgi:hypothetical protein